MDTNSEVVGIAVHGSGIYTETDQMHKIPDFDSTKREHYWLMIASFHVKPEIWKPEDRANLDMENLVSLVGPGCFYCESSYSAELASKPCAGDW